MVSLKLPSYVFSKLFVAAVLSFFQCLILLGIVTAMCSLNGSFAVALSILYLASLAGAAAGLCVSARSSTTEAAIAMLPLILLPVITLGGGIWPIDKMDAPLQQLAKITPSRWTFEGAMINEAASEPKLSAAQPLCPKPVCDVAQQAFPQPGRTPLRTCFLVLGAMVAFWLSVALGFLRMRDVR